jgi:hypothetical protein
MLVGYLFSYLNFLLWTRTVSPALRTGSQETNNINVYIYKNQLDYQ